MREIYKTNHGKALIVLPDDVDKDRIEASRDLSDKIDEFGWKGGVADLSVNAADKAWIHWKLTAPSVQCLIM